MGLFSRNKIEVKVVVELPLEVAWDYYTKSVYIKEWHRSNDEWECYHAENELVSGGGFLYKMQTNDKRLSNQLSGHYTRIDLHKLIVSKLSDGREVKVSFKSKGNKTEISQSVDSDKVNPEELQRGGWQALLDSYKNFVMKGA